MATSPQIQRQKQAAERNVASGAIYTTNMRRLWVLSLALVVGAERCLGGTGSPAASFVFGDSLVDAGNNNYIPTLSRANHPPYGIDLLPDRLPTGRYTNGRTIADILGDELGLTRRTPPYLSPEATGDVLLHGVNYASGAGGILRDTGRIWGGRISLDEQIDNFVRTRKEFALMLGEEQTQRLLGCSLFSVTMGANDFVNNYLLPVASSAVERAQVPPDAFIDELISTYYSQLMRLHTMGARKFIVVNIGPIGCIPYLRDLYPSPSGGCADVPNELAASFNQRPRLLVHHLNSNLTGSIFVYADVFRIVADIIDNYNVYGFEDADSACCQSIGLHGGLLPCGMLSRVCADRLRYVFWDAYHPSEATNFVIARHLLDGGLDEVSPMNIRQLMGSLRH